MNDNTGFIYDQEKYAKALANATDEERSHFKPMEIPPTAVQMRRHPPRVGRNEPCPCGSGLKFKKCCYKGK